MAHASDVVIIGGGIIGLTTAYFLGRQGLRVTVVERQRVGKEASWAGAGILPPCEPDHARTPFDALRALSRRLYPGLSRDLREETDVDNGFWVCGGLEFLAGRLDAQDDEWHGAGSACLPLDEEQVRALEPGLAAGLGSALFVPDLAQVRNPWHLDALSDACQARNVHLVQATDILGFRTVGTRVSAVLASHCDLAAERFLISTGAWTDSLLKPLGFTPGIRPIRGQMVLLRPVCPLFQRVLLWGPRYVVPRQDGRVLIGSTEEDAGFVKRTTALAVKELLDLAMRLVPALDAAELEATWAGLRPASRDGLPFLGPVPGWDNLWLAAGHYRSGIGLSPGSAQLMTEMILGQPPSIDPTPFRLDR